MFMYDRFRKRNVLMPVLWHGLGKAPARAMLRILQRQIDAINNNGEFALATFSLRHYISRCISQLSVRLSENFCVTQGGLSVLCCIVITKITADTPGKSMLTAQKLFNGEHGCCHCEAPGKNIRTDKGGNIRSYASAVDEPGKRRTHGELVVQSEEAEKEDKSVQYHYIEKSIFRRLDISLILIFVDHGCERHSPTR